MHFLHKTIAIMVGSFLLGVGVNIFLVPYKLLDGGTIGIGLILHYLTGIKVGFVVIIISIPIFMLSWVYKRSYLYNSLHGMLFSSLMIDMLYPLHSVGTNLYLAPLTNAVIGGIFVGSGLGLMLRFDTSIGGTDLLGQMFARYINLNPGIVIFLIDFFIVFTGSIFFLNTSPFLSCLTVFCVGIMSSLFSIKNK
ncbi:YitT family protein [Domibacillus mangrovi]|uniref:YitT family protein n=1 Tax=Domibacillus mangrovi TaxID=1714354 RepID=A0A1Q5P384_9BACI|nr:YitT family protein [Domibacillus mangrovi]OKL36720.1 hypothetical protein BLL40_08265 [Domibacillus mangrovi]